MLDVLITPRTPTIGRALLRAIAKAAGVSTCEAPHKGKVLMLYGLGGPDRYPLGLNHVVSGRTLVAWDLGYWDRKGDQRKLRVSINGLHSPGYIMRGPIPSRSRWDASGLKLESTGDPNGPIVLIGNGPKSNVIGAEGWAAAKSREIRSLWPNRQIVYRPKPNRPSEARVICDKQDLGPIDELLRSASLVVCRHSNVAVDACRLGVPVVCDDGAAAAIYPKALKDADQQPGLDLRTEFLIRLAWWQWSENESAQAWRWLCGVISCG